MYDYRRASLVPDGSFVVSESAPVPVARDTLGKATNHGVFAARSEAVEEGDTGSAWTGAVTGIGAVTTTDTKCFPAAIVREAAIACSRLQSLWMEFCVLVERDLMGGVLPAEDVSATSAMMATMHPSEEDFAVGVVASDSLVVFL